ncbi:hypothetical protein SL1157_0555 [Ruegeria lacuscaerulensis ITI-1157]|nr:hypothetical protein SL1157_0555 [Ruegeria lacuscaerulensis ITI-1157]
MPSGRVNREHCASHSHCVADFSAYVHSEMEYGGPEWLTRL